MVRVLSVLPSAAVSSSLAAAGGGWEDAHRRRWLICRSASARGWQNPAAAAPSSTSHDHHGRGESPPPAAWHLCVHRHRCVSSVARRCWRGAVWTYTPSSSKPGAVLARPLPHSRTAEPAERSCSGSQLSASPPSSAAGGSLGEAWGSWGLLLPDQLCDRQTEAGPPGQRGW